MLESRGDPKKVAPQGSLTPDDEIVRLNHILRYDYGAAPNSFGGIELYVVRPRVAPLEGIHQVGDGRGFGKAASRCTAKS